MALEEKKNMDDYDNPYSDPDKNKPFTNSLLSKRTTLNLPYDMVM